MFKKFLGPIYLILVLTFASSVYSGSDGSLDLSSKSKQKIEVKDCFEKLNRGVFAFNQGLDKVIFKPLAKGYRKLPNQ